MRSIDEISFEAANKIEDLFAQSHLGGATQRRARIQIEVINAMAAAQDRLVEALGVPPGKRLA